MRRFVSSVVILLVGIGVGIGGMLATERLQAQQAPQLQNQPEVRLITIPAPRGQARMERIGGTERFVQPAPGLVFFKDVKGDGCWLASLGDRNEAIALAVAPADACR